MALFRIKLRWTGFSGAPGYTILHFADSTEVGTYTAQTAADAAGAFIRSLPAILPNGVRVEVEPAVESINIATGQLEDYTTITPPTPALGSATGGYSVASGAVMNWNTSGVRNGRRVRGKSFFVPLNSTAYQSDGTIVDTLVTSLNTAATTLINDSASALVVYSRPIEGDRPGEQYLVTSARLSDKVAVLRSRRD